MSALQYITDHGVSVSLAGDKVRLDGLASLPPDEARALVEYAKANKARIMEELSQGWSWQALGPAAHSIFGAAGQLVQHHPSGRYALDVGWCLLTVDQEWAEAEVARWLQ